MQFSYFTGRKAHRELDAPFQVSRAIFNLQPDQASSASVKYSTSCHNFRSFLFFFFLFTVCPFVPLTTMKHEPWIIHDLGSGTETIYVVNTATERKSMQNFNFNVAERVCASGDLRILNFVGD